MVITLRDLRALVHEVELQTPPSADDTTVIRMDDHVKRGLWFEINPSQRMLPNVNRTWIANGKVQIKYHTPAASH